MRIELHSLRFKVTALAVGAVTITALCFATSYYLRAREQLTEVALSQLSDTARAEAVRIEMHFLNLVQEAQVLSGTAPIEGIIRTVSAPGLVDPYDATPLALWKDRLATIFVAHLKVNPAFTQIRYIGIADNGRELVRVDQKGGAIHRVVDARLQQKGDEPYMQRLAGSEPGDSFVSRVTLNREWGQVEGAGVPTIRFVIPVFDAADRLFGAVVINADYDALLAGFAPNLSPGIDLAVLNDQGDYMTFTAGGVSRRLRFHEDADWRPLERWSGLLVDGTDAERLRLADHTAFVRRITVGRGGEASSLWVIASARNNLLFAGVEAALSRDLAITGAIGVLLVLASGAFAARLSRPLERLARAMSDGSAREGALTLHIEARDEVGTVARAFQSMATDIVNGAARLAAIHAGAPVGIITSDAEGRILEMNPAAQTIFGFRDGEAVGKSLDVLMPDEYRGRHDGYIAGFRDDPKTMAEDRELLGLRQDGSLFPVSVTVSCVESRGGKTIIGIVRDISEKHAAQQEQLRLMAELEALSRDLARSNAELDRFAYIASHDLKAPLRVIDNASKWLEEDLTEFLNDDTRESMDLMRGRVRRMERLLDDLLAYSRVGRESHSFRPIAGNEILAHVMGLVALPDGFRIELGEGFDRVALPLMPVSTVFLNLIGNAIKHHDRAEGLIRVTVEDEGDAYVFAVEDDGPGIPPQFHEQVFAMFQTLKPRDDVEGSGMGLAFVKKIVEVANGSLTLESDKGRGAIFRVRWPRTRRDQMGSEAA